MEYTKLIVKSLLESDFIEAKRTLKDALFSKLDDKLQESKERVYEEDCGCEESEELDEKKLDPVDSKELKGKHKDRDDKDIDNDGDVDDSDEYLHNRRKTIAKAMKKESAEVDESVTRLKVPLRVQKKKQTRKAKDQKLDSRGLGVTRQSGLGRKTLKSSSYPGMDEATYPHKMYDKNGKEFTAKTPADHDRMSKMGYTHEKPKMINSGKGKHDCAKKVEHAEFGEGNCIHGQHAAPDENGNIAWYDVMFEHGVVKGVPITELNVLVSEMHHEHAHHAEGLETDIAKEKEKMAASKEKIKGMKDQMKREKE